MIKKKQEHLHSFNNFSLWKWTILEYFFILLITRQPMNLLGPNVTSVHDNIGASILEGVSISELSLLYWVYWSYKNGSPNDMINKALECILVVSLNSSHTIFTFGTLRKGMNPLIPSSYGLNSITAVLLQG